MPSQEQLRELFTYEPIKGRLIWKTPHKFSDKRPGDLAGYDQKQPSRSNYTYVMIDYHHYRAHRIIWTMLFGPIPQGAVIDHIDHDGLNNHLSNLRLLASPVLNARNQSKHRRNTSGVTGVAWFPQRNCWRAQIGGNSLGHFDTKEQAITARYDAERRLNYHPNHGR